MKRISSNIITAQPGYRAIYAVDGGYEVSHCDVLAWRIETFERDDGSLYSESFLIEQDGEAAGNVAGVAGPYGAGVLLFENKTYPSFPTFQLAMQDTGITVTGSSAKLSIRE